MLRVYTLSRYSYEFSPVCLILSTRLYMRIVWTFNTSVTLFTQVFQADITVFKNCTTDSKLMPYLNFILIYCFDLYMYLDYFYERNNNLTILHKCFAVIVRQIVLSYYNAIKNKLCMMSRYRTDQTVGYVVMKVLVRVKHTYH